MLRTLLFTILTGIVSYYSFAQNQTGSLSGRITDSGGGGLPQATVILKELQVGGVTDLDGNFKINKIPYGSYQLLVQYVGYISSSQRIVINQVTQELNVELKEDKQALEEVEIVGEGEAMEAKEGGFSVDIVKAEIFQNTSTDITQLIKGVSGVVVRESGGLGSNFNLSLNGLSGNQIRYFIDGVPMESFGSSLTLNNYPVNLINNIEVFKGVVPIKLGADALGGAVNITTSASKKSFIDAAYTYGSFNTHRASLFGQYGNVKKGFFVRASSFFNHSANNFWMQNVTVYDELGNPAKSIRTRRFHDQYTSGMGSVTLGVFNKKWTDELSLSFTGATNRKNYQHPDNNIKRIFGDFHTTNSTALATLVYKKTFEKLYFQSYALLGNMSEAIVDTSSRKYDWEGNYTIRDETDPKGELYERKSLFEFNDQVVRLNLTAEYDFSENHQLIASLTHSYLKRKGEDQVNEFNRSFESPNYIHKNLAGLAYQFKGQNQKLEATGFIKSYAYQGKIVSQDFDDNDVITEPEFGKLGFGWAGSLRLSELVAAKVSMEKTYRIPESYEILGDGIYVNPNPSLLPEKSYNANLGLSLTKQFARVDFKAESNLFYRSSVDFIRFAPLGPFGNYENLDRVKSEGIETSVEVKYNKWLS